MLTAGPWATGEAVINPSYASPRTFAALHAATGDGRWRRIAASSRRLVQRLTERPPHLPPDWARVEPWGVVATGAPSTGEPPRYGYDALRTPVRLAESCVAADRRIAARMWPAVRSDPPPAGDHPAALVAAAAAAGDPATRAELLDRAGELDAVRPGYYGAAWHALGRVLLTTRLLGGCR